MRELPEVPTQTFREWWRGRDARAEVLQRASAPRSATRRRCPRCRGPTTGRARRPWTSTCSASGSPTTRRPVDRTTPDASRRPSPRCCASARRRAARRHARVAGVELVPDEPPLDARALDALDGVITGCALGIAETGTIVLDGAQRSGRRALTLVPDLTSACRGGADRRPRCPTPSRALAEAAARRAADHAGVGAFGDVGYRARSGRGRARSATARSARCSASARA